MNSPSRLVTSITSAAQASTAGTAIPASEICFRKYSCHEGLHELPLADVGASPALEPLARVTERVVDRWTRVHDLPDFVYFNHAIHVHHGIGCSTCHGRIDKMPLDLAGTAAYYAVVSRLSLAPRDGMCVRSTKSIA